MLVNLDTSSMHGVAYTCVDRISCRLFYNNCEGKVEFYGPKLDLFLYFLIDY